MHVLVNLAFLATKRAEHHKLALGCVCGCLQDALGTITDAAASTADKEAALTELQVLVEPIDNANGEQTMFN